MSQMKSRKSPMTDEYEDCQWLIKYVNTAKYIYHNWRSCLMWHRNRFIQFWLISKNWQKYPNRKGRKGKNRNAIALISLFFSPKQILRDNWESFWNLHLSSETEPSFKRSQRSLKLADTKVCNEEISKWTQTFLFKWSELIHIHCIPRNSYWMTHLGSVLLFKLLPLSKEMYFYLKTN